MYFQFFFFKLERVEFMRNFVSEVQAYSIKNKSFIYFLTLIYPNNKSYFIIHMNDNQIYS